MAAEYLANAPQNVALNAPIIFPASIPCRRGNIYHEDETGIFILRGNTNQCFATYRVTYNGNVTVAEGGAVTPIAVALAVSGEPRLTSRAIYTPAAAGPENYGNLTSTAIIKVPRGCCFALSVEYVPASEDPTVTPTPIITVPNSNLVIDRIA